MPESYSPTPWDPTPAPAPISPDADFEYMPNRLIDPFEGDYSQLAWETHWVRIHGQNVPMPRLIAMYGSAYTYSGVHHPAVHMPTVLDDVRKRVEELTGKHYNSVLCNLYRDGRDSVSWHSDNDYPCTHPWIASVSFGATRRFRVRHKRTGDSHHWDLTSGSIIVMKDAAQENWMHCVPKTGRETKPRLNLTYRHIEG